MTNPANLFPSAPDSASLWCYASSKPLPPEVETELLAALEAFFSTWTSHEKKVVGEADLLNGRHLFISAYVPDGDVSGCGIDKSTRVLREIAISNDFEWLDGLEIHFRDDAGTIQAVSRRVFRSYIRDGVINGETLVFDLTARKLNTLRENGFEKPASESWHASAFGLASVQEA